MRRGLKGMTITLTLRWWDDNAWKKRDKVYMACGEVNECIGAMSNKSWDYNGLGWFG
jgi:hypothetical protein